MIIIIIILDAETTLQDPVDLSMVSQPHQRNSNGSQVDSVLLQSLAAATVQLDGPLCYIDKIVITQPPTCLFSKEMYQHCATLNS